MNCCFDLCCRLLSFTGGVILWESISNCGEYSNLLCSCQFGGWRYYGERHLFAVDVSGVAGSGGCAEILSRDLFFGGSSDGDLGAVEGWIRYRWLGG